MLVAARCKAQGSDDQRVNFHVNVALVDLEDVGCRQIQVNEREVMVGQEVAEPKKVRFELVEEAAAVLKLAPAFLFPSANGQASAAVVAFHWYP